MKSFCSWKRQKRLLKSLKRWSRLKFFICSKIELQKLLVPISLHFFSFSSNFSTRIRIHSSAISSHDGEFFLGGGLQAGAGGGAEEEGGHRGQRRPRPHPRQRKGAQKQMPRHCTPKGRFEGGGVKDWLAHAAPVLIPDREKDTTPSPPPPSPPPLHYTVR